ncbi:MAG: hypothetical protein V1763_03305 [Parcubacteria group bacterium]
MFDIIFKSLEDLFEAYKKRECAQKRQAEVALSGMVSPGIHQVVNVGSDQNEQSKMSIFGAIMVLLSLLQQANEKESVLTPEQKAVIYKRLNALMRKIPKEPQIRDRIKQVTSCFAGVA